MILKSDQRFPKVDLFEFFVRLNSKLWRQGRCTLQAAARPLDLAMERWEERLPMGSGGGKDQSVKLRESLWVLVKIVGQNQTGEVWHSRPRL